MTVDRPRAREHLAHIGESLAGLRSLAAIPAAEYFGDFRNPRTAERLLQTAIQSMIELAIHVVARTGLPRPDTGEALFAALAQAGALKAERVQKCREMAGLSSPRTSSPTSTSVATVAEPP